MIKVIKQWYREIFIEGYQSMVDEYFITDNDDDVIK
jgi:hypothetical protein